MKLGLWDLDRPAVLGCWRFITIMVSLLVLAGCSVAALQKEVETLYRVTVVIGRISVPDDWYGPVIVAAVEESSKRRVAHQVWLHEPGGYELIVPDGRYRIVAYGDRDGDHLPDVDDPGAMTSTSIEVDGLPLIWFDLQLRFGDLDSVRAALPTLLPAPKTHSSQAGALADLNSPALSVDVGKLGYWAPIEFVRDVGGNVYCLEPYDPARAIVLFVHGASGSAQDFSHFYDRVDRSRYQSWIFQYPSGAALDANADLLYWKLLQLQSRHTLGRVNIVAHSMGGLLVRHFLSKYGSQFPQIDRFVSISTPWAGEPAAGLGVKHSIAVLPSWRDMEPEGKFIRELFDRPLPSNVAHTLLFGHRGGYNAFRPTTDGAVTLASQLRPEAQASANQVLGFDEDHVSVLAAPQVLTQVLNLLDTSDPDTSAAVGAVHVAIAQDGPRPQGEGFVEVAFTRSDANGAGASTTIVMPLRDAGAERLVARLAPGAYDARVLSPFFRDDPSTQAIRVRAGQISHSTFRLAPRGALIGDILLEEAEQADDTVAAKLATPIRQLSLDGPHGRRVLIPSLADASLTSALAAGRDALVGTQFLFIDLPRGVHTLSIIADGYEPHTSTHVVEFGVIPPIAPIVLRRLQNGR